jgi:hypothetical protein
METGMSKHLFMGVVAISSILLAAGAFGQSVPTAADFIKMVTTDNSKTISLPEIDTFAMKKFGELKKPGEEVLSMVELRDRISQADFDAANTTRGNSATVPTSVWPNLKPTWTTSSERRIR